MGFKGKYCLPGSVVED